MRRFFFGFACICLVAAIGVLPGEYRSFTVSERAELQWYLNPDASQLPPLRSSEGTYGVLVACLDTLNSMSHRLMPTVSRVDVANGCLETAEMTLTTSPGLAPAHLVRAVAFAELATDLDGTLRAQSAMESAMALRRAERLGPELLWMVIARLDVSLTLFAGLHIEGRDLLARDIARILENGRSEHVQHLVRRYNEHTQAREFIVSVVEKLELQQQRTFLSTLRAMS